MISAYYFRTEDNKVIRIIVGVSPESVSYIELATISDGPLQPFDVIKLGYDIDEYCLPITIGNHKDLVKDEIPYSIYEGVVYVMKEDFAVALTVSERSKNRIN